jgi:Family of unknown function (DUF6152)
MRSVRKFFGAASLLAALAVCAPPASAHHSFGHYNMTATSEVEGTVSKWEWGNPHCWLFIVNPKDGKTYGFELRSPGELMRSGWKRTSVNVGDKIKVSYRPMKDGTPAGLMQRVYDSNGKLIGRPLGGGDMPPPAPAPAA